MTRFVQQSNGKVRRIRGTIGGSKAWRQHYESCSWDDPSERRRLIEQTQDRLAEEQLRDHLATSPFIAGHRNQDSRRNDNRRPQHTSTVAPATLPVVEKAQPRPRFKVIISDSGTIVAVPLN
jgi:hypothetical protein